MAVNEQFIPERKAYSAEKPKESYESPSSDSGLEEIGNRTFKTCASASFLSARERRHAQKALENSLQEEFSPRYHKIYNRENQKLFLQSSQILEKLNKIISKTELISQNNSKEPNKRKLNVKQIIVYHDKLRKLMVKRSSIMLLEECDISIKKTRKCVEDFKHLYVNDKVKMTTMPLQAFNRFVSSSDINISSLELLIKKLKVTCDIHSSVNNNYQKVINLFHSHVDLELNIAILKTNKILNSLKIELFYWSDKCVNIFIKKLCLADPNSVSPDFLQRILKALYVYNALIKENKEAKFNFSKTSFIFKKYILQHQNKAISFDLILDYLSFYEAKVASERIVNFLSSNCKKYQKADLKKKNLNLAGTSKELSEINASNASKISHQQIVNKSSFSTFVSNFSNVLLVITQRNQSLILKYMYSITSLESILISKNRRNFDNSTPVSSARQMWDIPQLYNKDESYIMLEENYWTNFWNNVKKFILKLLYDLPYHQYGDSAVGTVILWPNTFFELLTESLKFCADNKDFSQEGRYAVKQVYDHLIIHQARFLWDKEFSSTLPTVQAHLCPAAPTFQNRVNTLPGNSLNKCIQVLMEVCSKDLHQSNYLLYLTIFLHLQTIIDTYILWVNTKTRALIASQNLPSYLLISSSDCSDACRLLEAKAIPLISDLSSSNSLKRMHPSHIFIYKSLLSQTDLLTSYPSEVPIILFDFVSFFTRETLIFLLKKTVACQSCLNDRFRNLHFDTIYDILSPMTEVLKSISNACPIIMSLSSAVSQAFLLVLNKNKKPLNLKRIHILCTEHSTFTQWLNKLNLLPSDMEKIKQSDSFKKLSVVLKFLQDLSSQKKYCLRRQNRIGQVPLEEFSIEHILSQEEKIYWERKCTKPICSSCF